MAAAPLEDDTLKRPCGTKPRQGVSALISGDLGIRHVHREQHEQLFRKWIADQVEHRTAYLVRHPRLYLDRDVADCAVYSRMLPGTIIDRHGGAVDFGLRRCGAQDEFPILVVPGRFFTSRLSLRRRCRRRRARGSGGVVCRARFWVSSRQCRMLST